MAYSSLSQWASHLGDVVGPAALVGHAHFLQRSARRQIVFQVRRLHSLEAEFLKAEGHGGAADLGGVALAPERSAVPVAHASPVLVAANPDEAD